ncbi:LacI family transcriptional regulator [Opitutaceae bacterium TAV4]|nr:LacI family transcriptional regulator [Opitutaceae bacterium TAV4]RRK02672.1 LacI family transcriptional regulator [Opitutaceae bacterium TAV3]
MKTKPSAVTLQAIADRTGFSRSSVSLALRGHPSLPAATRDAIRLAADELGYRPNPLIGALMSQLRDQRRERREKREGRARRETIAVISRLASALELNEKLPPGGFYHVLNRALMREAEARGLAVDRFHHDPARMSDERLGEVLKARDIHGVIFFPGRDDAYPNLEYPELDWWRFTTVLIGFNTRREGLHRVVTDYTHDIDTALERIRASGAQRVGFAVAAAQDRATNHAWSSRYLFYQHTLPARRRVPLFSPDDHEMPGSELLAWYRRHRPDVILTAGAHVAGRLAEAGVNVPRDVRLVNLVQRGERGLAGIDPHTEEVGRAAVELLVSMLQSNQRGLAEFPRMIAIKGKWTPGESFPEGEGED